MQNFQSNKAVGAVALVLLGLNFLLSLFSISYLVLGARDILNNTQALDEWFWALNPCLTFLNGVFFVVWMYGSAMNIQRAGYRQLPWKPKMAVVGWIIPIGNLIFPYRMMVSMFELYDELRGVILSGKSKRSTSNSFLGAWWAFFIGGYMVQCIPFLLPFYMGIMEFTCISELMQAASAIFIGYAVLKMLAWEQRIREALLGGLAVNIPQGLKEPVS